jgi:hypothetical protein
VTFTKLFSSITASTVWCRPSDTRVVWITMLAMADRHGRVWASIPGLAKEAAVSVEACRTAIDEFLAPDPDSRTKVHEGRRIEEIDGGWKLINHAKYRAIRDQEERRNYKTEKQREYRKVDKVDKSGHRGPNVDSGGHNAEAEADTEAEEQKQKPSRAKRERTKTAIADERHASFKAAIKAYWDSKNIGIEMPWGPVEGKQLSMWLREAPHITLEQFKGFLRNRYKSQINHGERPAQWIKWITSYGPGPMDRFKNTAQASGAANGKTDRNIEAARNVIAEFESDAGTDRGKLISGSGGDGSVPEIVRAEAGTGEAGAVVSGSPATGGEATRRR